MPDAGVPGGYPMHSQGMHPNAGALPQGQRGAALPPPVAPINPIAGMMGQLPQRSPITDPTGNAATLSRPAAIGGSRLSLLARQLTTPEDGAAGLPIAPTPLSNAELPGQRPLAHSAPDGAKNQQAGAMMLKDSMPRGLRVSRSPSRGKAKFAIAALLILSLLGALLWVNRAPLKDIYVQVFPPKPVLPETAPPAPSRPVPGVDKAVQKLPTLTKNADSPTLPGGAKSEVLQDPEQVKPRPKALPIPAPEEVDGIAKMSNGEQVKKPEPLSPTNQTPPPAPKNDRDLIATMNAPRAIAVDPNDEKPADAAASNSPSTPPPVNPLLEGKQKMVEVGRSNADPKTETSVPPAPAPSPNSNQPPCRNMPPNSNNCKVAYDGLVNFLNARKWQDRLKYIQLPDQMEPKLKLYYATNSDGPVDVDEIGYLTHHEAPQVGKGMHVVFVLISRNWEMGIPVMVEVTPEGARVDWLTFIEFKDDMLNKFLSNYMEERVQFHVGIHRTHYFDESIPNLNQKEQFSVSSPMGNVKGFVFVPKGTPFARSIANTITWDKEESYVVVELQWRKEGANKWVEMTNIPQLNWYSAGAQAPKATAVVDEAEPPAAIPVPKGNGLR